MQTSNSPSRKPWRFEAKSNNEAEIFLYNEIGSDGMGSGTTAEAFVSDLRALGPVSQITVRLNSPGGSVPDGVAIFNALVQHPARIITRITTTGTAGSGCYNRKDGKLLNLLNVPVV